MNRQRPIPRFKIVKTSHKHGFNYRVMKLVRAKKRTRGNPYRWICIAIGTKHLKDLK